MLTRLCAGMPPEFHQHYLDVKNHNAIGFAERLKRNSIPRYDDDGNIKMCKLDEQKKDEVQPPSSSSSVQFVSATDGYQYVIYRPVEKIVLDMKMYTSNVVHSEYCGKRVVAPSTTVNV